MPQLSIIQENYTFSYQTFGHGNLQMLAFHGYGQDSSVYKELEEVFPQHTIYSIDLFFHGQSEWHADLDSLNNEQWQNILDSFLRVYQIEHFDLLGFSMGGRIALVTTSLFADRVKNLYLLAPDGIQINAWYRVATKFTPLQGIFKYFTHSETSIYRKLVKKIGKYGLVHRTVLKLADTEMSTPEKRKRVYKTWMLYRFLEVEIADLSKQINGNAIKTMIYVGRYDRLIHEKMVHLLARHLKTVHTEVLESGHHKLIHAFREKLLANASSS